MNAQHNNAMELTALLEWARGGLLGRHLRPRYARARCLRAMMSAA
jgi:hypothetical protein